MIPHLQPGHKGPVTKTWQYNMSILFKKTKPRPSDPFPQRARLQPSKGRSGGTLQDARLAGLCSSPSPPPSPLLLAEGGGLPPASSWVHQAPGTVVWGQAGAVDMQGLRAAREGPPSPGPRPRPAAVGPRKADSSVPGDGVSEEGTCTEALVPSFPTPPAECSKVNKDGGPRPGPLTREGKRGLLPSPSFCSPQSWYYSHRPPEKMHMHLPMPRIRAYAEPIGLRPSAQRSPVITGRACCPRARSTRSGSLGGERPCLEPRSVLLSPRREWAMEHGWKPGPEWHDDGARTPGAARQASLGPPAASRLRLSTRGPGRLCRGRGCHSAARRCG